MPGSAMIMAWGIQVGGINRSFENKIEERADEENFMLYFR
jgi:hypothetical protein